MDAFVEALCEHHGVDRLELERRMDSQIPSSRVFDQGMDATLSGSYACYSKVLSPYYSGQLTYTEALPAGSLVMVGPVTMAKRGLYIHLKESGGDAQFFLSLFLPSSPGGVLAGYMCGTTIIGPQPLPSAVRILMVRMTGSSSLPYDWGGYFQPSESIVEDLAKLGIALNGDGRSLDCKLWQFLDEDTSNGPCQVTEASFRSIVDVFDRHWLQH